MTLDDFRRDNPEYANTPNGKLAFGLWNKHYKGKLPMGQFADKLGLSSEDFKGMVEFSKQSGYEPTGRTFAEGYEPPMSTARAGFQGMTYGAGDEIVGGMTAGVQKLQGDKRPISDLYGAAVKNEREMLDQYRDVNPMGAYGTEIAGSFLSPVNMLKAPAGLARLGSTGETAAKAAAGSGLYAFNAAEGGVEDRLAEVPKAAAAGAIFGAGTQKLADWALKLGNKAAMPFVASLKTPTVDSLRTAKTAAYREVDNVGGTIFGLDDMSTLYNKASNVAKAADYVPDVHKRVNVVQKMLENKQGQAMTLGQLDKLRQGIWRVHSSAKPDEQYIIRGMIDELDGLIDSKLAGGDNVLKLARTANARYKKAELLEDAFDKVNRQMDASGVGDVAARYKAAVNRILDSKDLRFFNEDEVALFRAFVKGDISQDAKQAIGKLSPTSGGLMTALSIGGAAIDPTFLVASGTAAAMKKLSESQIRQRAENLQHFLGTGGLPLDVPTPVPFAAPAWSSIPTNYIKEDEEDRR